jgi:hypothetical protein
MNRIQIWEMWRWVCLALFVTGVPVEAQTVVRSNEYATQEHTQTSEAGAAATGEYRFVLDAPRTSRNIGSFMLPNGSVSLGANTVYPSMEALQTQYPPGTNTANLEHWARVTGPPTFHTLQADFPATPTFHDAVPHVSNESWEGGVLVVDPNFTLTIDPWEGRPQDSLIHLRVQTPSGSYTSSAYGRDLTSVAFGEGSTFQLQPNSSYPAVLTFVDFFDSESTSIPGSSPAFPEEFRFELGTGNSVRFTIVTVPEPTSMALGGLGAVILLWRKRRVTAKE